MSVTEVAQAVYDLCREGRNMDALLDYYADDVESIESAPWGDQPRQVNGIEAVKGKNQWWFDNNEVHSGSVQGPFVHGDDRFALVFAFDVTPKGGERMQMTEVGVYTVAKGKVAREEFFVPPAG